MANEATYHLLRPPDLVVLTITAVGLTEQQGVSGPELVSQVPQAELIVEFPPQHIAETVSSPGSTSSQARLAGPSRLHFQVDDKPILLSASGILSAMSRLTLTSQANASTLEIPWRVLLALDSATRCVHRSSPSTSNANITELWHTRLTRDGNAYTTVYPRATLPVEAGFAANTPLGQAGFYDTISAQVSAHPNQAMSVEQLILTGSGAWFNGSISWPEHEWTHRSTMGRDVYVRVAESGVLFPFGHKATFVETFEREFSGDAAPVASLRATRILVINERSREYEIAERAFPFQAVELGPLTVTELDQPASTTMFWPTRGGAPVLFSVRARAAQDIIEMSLPLLFTTGAAPPVDRPSASLADIYAHGPLRDGAPSAFVGRFMPIAMKSNTEVLRDAVQQVRSLTLGGKSVLGGIGFHPIVTLLEVELPAVRQLLGEVKPITATWSTDLLTSLPGAEPDVLLEFSPRPLNFAAARAGVVAAPNMNVNQLSRSMGPIVAQLPTNPAELFPGEAKLLGIVALRDLIGQVTGRPKITWSADGHPSATLTWVEKLTRSAAAFAPTAGSTSMVSLTVQTTTDGMAPAGHPPAVTTHGEITNFTLRIPPQDTLLELDFHKLTFDAKSGTLPNTAFSIAAARLTGNLQFVQKLQESLPKVGNTAPSIVVSDRQIKATFIIVVPTPLSIGVFTLRNLLLKAAITLSFVNEPVLVEFGFASREQPFLLAVNGFGGGGYLELAISAGGGDGGLQRFIGALEFGACAAMDFGVANGEVHVFGGVVFAKTGHSVEITGYLRIGGMVRVLGLVSVSVELTIAMTYVPNVLTGSAKLVITVDLTFWSTSVEIACSKTFAGSETHDSKLAFAADVDRGSSVQDALGRDRQSYPWQTYCLAFAQE